MALQEHVMLSNEVSRDGMQTHAQYGPRDKVHNWFESPNIVDKNVCCELHDCIHHLHPGHWFWVHHQRPQCIEEGLEEEPEYLPCRCAEEPAFQVCRDVHIQAIPSQVAVVVDVVFLEGGRVREADGQVGKHGEPSVPAHLLVSKCDVVRDVMDGQGQGVV